jgi:hypothetical protein
VLTTIDLDDDLPFTADKVADIATDWHLPRELVAIDLSISDAIPQHSLRVCLIGAQLPR